MKKVHEGHLGIEKCRKRVYVIMYWHRINHDLTTEGTVQYVNLTNQIMQQNH